MKRSMLVNLVSLSARFSLRCAPFAIAVALPVTACKGPEPDPRTVPLDIPESSAMVIQWPDGPRRPNAELVLQKAAEDYAGQLFQGEPMPRDLPPEAAAAPTPEAAPTPAVAPDGEDPKPAWADGVAKPPEVAENDMPRAWPIEVKLGETPALLAEWSGGDGKQIIADNEEMLGKRKWLKTGDRISVSMTANQKIAFDRKRDAFQKQRVDAFFNRRYFEKVVVYRVKKGEYISAAAKRYGDVPLWLIEEFNQMDFRGLQPGDEILIPVVSALEPGQSAPPPLQVVDEDGHSISEARKANIDGRLKGDFMARARLALDDSNVFMRARPVGDVGQPGPSMADPTLVAAAPSQGAMPVGPAVVGGERQLPPAAIGAHELLPEYRIGPPPAVQAQAQAANQAAQANQGGSAGPGGGAPAGVVVVQPASEGPLTLRDVVVKRGESLLHYVKWSQVSLDQVKASNPHLDPQRIFVGARVAIPMTDTQYVAFVKARSAWEKAQDGAAADDGQKPAAEKPASKKHTVKAGDTATSIARHYKIAVKALKVANPKANLKKLKPGTKLIIPAT
ncbi:MAG: LysM peptidoglycan-binding domain-containing protein [Myxococcota bacterium]